MCGGETEAVFALLSERTVDFVRVTFSPAKSTLDFFFSSLLSCVRIFDTALNHPHIDYISKLAERESKHSFMDPSTREPETK